MEQLINIKLFLISKGFHQCLGINFFQIFSPIIKPAILRVICAITTSNRWPICQLDLTNTFIHGDLNEPVFIKQPLGFQVATYPDHED